MPLYQCLLTCVGILLITGGGGLVLSVGRHSPPLFGLGLFLSMAGVGLLVTGLCVAKKNLQVAVPQHFLRHPRTGTRLSPRQAQTLQRRLERIRREMSTDSVSRAPEPEASLPSTPPPWTMEPPRPTTR